MDISTGSRIDNASLNQLSPFVPSPLGSSPKTQRELKYLFPRNRILHQHQMCQPLERAQHIQICQLGEIIRSQD